MNPEEQSQNSQQPEPIAQPEEYQSPVSRDVLRIAKQKAKLKKLNSSFKSRFYRLSNSRFVFVSILVIFVPVVLLFVYSLIFLFNLDQNFIQISVGGTILSETGEPVELASISVDGVKIAETDSNGNYSYTIEEGEHDIEIVASNFEKIERKEQISNGFLDYSIDKDYILQNTKITMLSGKLLVEDNPSYSFSKERVTLNDSEYKVNTDGTFQIPNVKVGQVNFKVFSPNYIDIDRQINLTTNDAVISDITLKPAGDIVGISKNYVTQTPVSNLSFQVANVNSDRVSISEDGTFRIRDLVVGDTYQFRVSAQNYLTRDYELTVAQGENELLNFVMVPDEKFIYIAEDAAEEPQIFSSELDGNNVEQLTNTENLDPSNYFFDKTNSKIYFQTDIDNVNGTYTGDIPLVYQYDLLTKESTKLTKASNNYGDLIPNFALGLMTNVWKDDNNKHNFEYMDLTGGSIKNIDTFEFRAVGKTFIRNEGNNIFYVINSQGETSLIQYTSQTNVNTEILNDSTLQVLDVSFDGKRVLYVQEDAQGFNNLRFLDTETNEIRDLVTNAQGSNYQFVTNSNSEFIYLDKINDKTDVYKYSIDSNSISQITRVSATEPVVKYFQQNGFVYYTTKNGTYVLSLSSPVTYRKVLDQNIQIP